MEAMLLENFHENIMPEILLKLPVKSMGRCIDRCMQVMELCNQ